MKDGRPDFHQMQLRAKATGQRDIERKAKSQPATYVIFDILEKDGKSLTNLPLVERKQILRGSIKEGSMPALLTLLRSLGKNTTR